MNKLFYLGLAVFFIEAVCLVIFKDADIIVAAIIYAAAVIIWTVAMGVLTYLSNK